MHVRMYDSEFYNMDCIEGARKHIPDASVDLLITDPPYGIDGDSLDQHYNRDESWVVDGYVEVSAAEYAAFSRAWIREAERCLRPGGQLYVVSGYSRLLDILQALRETSLEEINHIIWKYNFGVYTRNKYVSSHYHILYYAKPGGSRTFHREVRFGDQERDEHGGSLNYQDREDVWSIPRDYKPGRRKNKNELPDALLMKMIQYSSNPGDRVADFFLGGFSTARVAWGLDRHVTGFELSSAAFQHGAKSLEGVEPGELLPDLRSPKLQARRNQGKRWSVAEVSRLSRDYEALRQQGSTKGEAIHRLSQRLGRGRFGVERKLKEISIPFADRTDELL